MKFYISTQAYHHLCVWSASVCGRLQRWKLQDIQDLVSARILEKQTGTRHRPDSYRAFPGATRWQHAWHQGIGQHWRNAFPYQAHQFVAIEEEMQMREWYI